MAKRMLVWLLLSAVIVFIAFRLSYGFERLTSYDEGSLRAIGTEILVAFLAIIGLLELSHQVYWGDREFYSVIKRAYIFHLIILGLGISAIVTAFLVSVMLVPVC